jgi:hypothetical protein
MPWRTGASGAQCCSEAVWAQPRQPAEEGGVHEKKEGYMYPSFFCYPSAPRTSLCSEVRGTARHRRLGLRCLGGGAVGRFQGLVPNFRFYGKTRTLMCCLGFDVLPGRCRAPGPGGACSCQPGRCPSPARSRSGSPPARRRGPLLWDRAAPGCLGGPCLPGRGRAWPFPRCESRARRGLLRRRLRSLRILLPA